MQTTFIWLRRGCNGGLLSKTVMSIPVSYKMGDFLTSWVTISFTRNLVYEVCQLIFSSLSPLQSKSVAMTIY